MFAHEIVPQPRPADDNDTLPAVVAVLLLEDEDAPTTLSQHRGTDPSASRPLLLCGVAAGAAQITTGINGGIATAGAASVLLALA